MNESMTQADSEHTLEVLRILEDDSSATQREISQRLQLSLGKINFLIKSMIAKGLLKAKRFTNSNNKRAYLYVLTAKGFERKLYLTRNFLEKKIREYDRLQAEIESLKKSLDSYDDQARLIRQERAERTGAVHTNEEAQ